MQDSIFGLLLLGCTTGIIPALAVIITIQVLIWLFKGMQKATEVLSEEEPPKPVVRNVREELWDEQDLDEIDQYNQEREDANA